MNAEMSTNTFATTEVQISYSMTFVSGTTLLRFSSWNAQKTAVCWSWLSIGDESNTESYPCEDSSFSSTLMRLPFNGNDSARNEKSLTPRTPRERSISASLSALENSPED
jgi:hypothetical protein